ncbi:MAG: HAMP domain-containing histidine kinase [Ignavibacteriae bacterium]|nr:HAMP domain-containing histidine kinase [Ignavibacteriota bacterium]
MNFERNDFHVLADERQLSQLFPLLIENAIDACDGKGKIDIRCEYQDLRDIRFRTDNYAGTGKPETRQKKVGQAVEQENIANQNSIKYVKITISDNGKGMSEEILQKIFEPYFTTKKDGTGMGLSLSKKIVEDNKGSLEIKSKKGKGTEVVVCLPSVE